MESAGNLPALIRIDGLYELRSTGLRIRSQDKEKCFDTLMLAMINGVKTDGMNPTLILVEPNNNCLIHSFKDKEPNQ
jgi:hypothetical protein